MEVAKLSSGCPLLVTTGSGMLDSPRSELQQRLCPKEPSELFRTFQNTQPQELPALYLVFNT